MKVALLGNMNNMMFQQLQYYTDWNIDTTLFLFDEFDHFLPESDVFYDVSTKFKIVKLGWSIESYHKVSKSEIRNLFVDFDVLIGTDVAPAYLYKAGLKLDIFCLHGSDLYEYPFFRFKKNTPSLWETNRCDFSLSQYEGVKLANYVALFKGDDLYETPISIIRKEGKRMASTPYFYTPLLRKDYFSQSTLNDELNELKDKFAYLILHHCSHNWVTNRDSLIYKGNDKVIYAFSSYIHSSQASKKACLILLEYGPDVEKSKGLIKDLGIEENVYWFPKQQRKNLLALVNAADLGVGELGNQGWMTYSVIVEFIILSKPSIHYRNSKIYEKNYPSLYEMVDTDDPDVVASAFLEFETNPQKYVDIGASANKWFKEHFHDIALKSFEEKIGETSANSKKVTIMEYLSYSNKMEKIKSMFWTLYNVMKIKLKLG